MSKSFNNNVAYLYDVYNVHTTMRVHKTSVKLKNVIVRLNVSSSAAVPWNTHPILYPHKNLWESPQNPPTHRTPWANAFFSFLFFILNTIRLSSTVLGLVGTSRKSPCLVITVWSIKTVILHVRIK